MGRGFFTFSSGILLGFAAGVLIDSEKRKRLQEIAKTQSDRLKNYEKSFKEGLDRIKNIIDNKS